VTTLPDDPTPIAPEDTPTMEDVRRLNRRHNWMTLVIAAPLFVLAAIATWAAIDGRQASEGGTDAVEAVLADNGRGACITERRNEELAAIGDELTALGRAQIAYFIEQDGDRARREVEKFEEAEARRVQAVAALSEDVIDLPPPVGCGPPVTTELDLPDNDRAAR
jgi:hypothetical protein